VVAVTRGTLQTLTRDELQGVIGHEFSHILNGDMRLNIRMIGVLAGVLFIGAIGGFIMRSVGQSRDSKASGRHLRGRPRAFHHRLRRPLLHSPHQGRRVAAARIPRRRFGRAIHPQSGRGSRVRSTGFARRPR
jgi:hypothetical protein